MRRRYAFLLVFVVCVCLACGSNSPKSSSPAVIPSIAATDSDTLATATATETPSPSPTPFISEAWTTKAVALFAKASDEGAAQVHLGANFPLTLTAKSATVEGQEWYEATWQTTSRKATGWLPASVVTRTKPSGLANAGIDALDEDLAEYLTALGARIGVDAYDVTRGVTYTYNADLSYFCASSVKVPIMLTLLTQFEAKGREPTKHELVLLRTMIENSNNTSAEALYEEIGAQKGINAFMRGVGISGLVPNKPGWWGHSTIKPSTMVALLTKLNDGTVLNDAHRKLALGYMEHVDAAGKVGIGDSSPAGATIAMKDGWTTALDGTGTSVVNTSGIVTLGAETYILSVYTDHNRGYAAGWKIIRHVAKVVGQRLMPTT
jgi:beta-lactamase class A